MDFKDAYMARLALEREEHRRAIIDVEELTLRLQRAQANRDALNDVVSKMLSIATKLFGRDVVGPLLDQERKEEEARFQRVKREFA